jgi:hypothetical protein
MSTRTTALHVPELVEHAAHDVAHVAAAVGHAVVEVARHEADVVVDAVLSPLTPSIEDLDLELTEDDVL